MSNKIFSKYDKTKEIKRKLKVDEYVLEIAGKDIFAAEITYAFDYLESKIYKNGKKCNVIKKPIINIELRGNDKDGNDAWICFEINADINYLNTLTEVPTNISHLLSESESFIKIPLEESSQFLNFDLPTNTEEDIYKNLSSLWVSKIKKNEFIIKLCVPNEVFTFFKIIF